MFDWLADDDLVCLSGLSQQELGLYFNSREARCLIAMLISAKHLHQATLADLQNCFNLCQTKRTFVYVTGSQRQYITNR